MPEPNDIITYPADGLAMAGGEIIPTGAKRSSAAEILDSLKELIEEPYMGKDPDLIGMSLIKAGLAQLSRKAADGDTDALMKILDRILGKPIQQVANLNLNATLQETLNEIARADASANSDIDPLS